MVSPALAFFLTAPRNVVYLDCIEISHSSFSQVYRKVRNSTAAGLDVMLETGDPAHFEFYPLQITELENTNNLDTGFQISFGDLGEVLPLELDAVYNDDNFIEKPQITYRAYRSDDLTTPLLGPLVLEAPSFSFTKEGASFEAVAPYVNNTTTGQTYNLTRFVMLRGTVI